MPGSIIPPVAGVLAGMIALLSCNSTAPPGTDETQTCAGCEWLIRGQSVRAAALRSDGESLYLLKRETRELHRFPHNGGEAELVAQELPGAADFLVGESVIWVLRSTPSSVIVLDKQTGTELASRDIPGLFGIESGTGNVPLAAVGESFSQRIVSINELGDESAPLWQGSSTEFFSAFAAGASGAAWILSTHSSGVLYWLPTQASEPIRVDLQADETFITLLAIFDGSVFGVGGDGDGGQLLYGLNGAELRVLGALPPRTDWLTPAAGTLLASTLSSRELQAFGLDGLRVATLVLPFEPKVSPVADSRWIFVGGETDLVRISLSELAR